MRLASVDKMLEGRESRYALVMGVAKRAREIAQEFEDNTPVFRSQIGRAHV